MNSKVSGESREPESAQEALAPELNGLRSARIARLAYSYAEQRGFEANHELDDWLRAEREVDSEEALLTK